MIVFCINNDNIYEWQSPLPLTIGKKYTHIKNFITYENMYFTVIDDEGEEHNYHRKHFMELEVWRDKQIDKLI